VGCPALAIDVDLIRKMFNPVYHYSPGRQAGICFFFFCVKADLNQQAHRANLAIARLKNKRYRSSMSGIASSVELNDLDDLESEAIFILREVAAQFHRPVILFSGGKDSALITHLAQRAFFPRPMPWPLMLVDTGQNFPETLEFIQARKQELKVDLVVASVQESIDQGRVVDVNGPLASRNRLQSVTLMDAIHKHKFDAVIGGGRRDEEKARAKERIFSLRNEKGEWEAQNQQPQLWNLLNGHLQPGHHMRVFPISNWTELDVWRYIEREKIQLPSIYFSHRRSCLRTESQLLAYDPCLNADALPKSSYEIVDLDVRCRTVGDMTCTGVWPSTARTVSEVICEIEAAVLSERGGRMDDRVSKSAMEDRKKEGYF
jgi:sulfate adenylyltransferase subunit 2